MSSRGENINRLIDSLLEKYDVNTTNILGRISNTDLVVYLIIFIIFLVIAQYLYISLTTIFLLFIALLVCYIIYSRKQIDRVSTEEELKIKTELIIPRPMRIDNYPDLIDFLFSIRDFYYINPNAFYGIVQNVDNFIQLYDEIMNDRMIYCTQNAEVANGFVRNAENNLQSMIYNLDIDQNITRKFHQSLREFTLIMRQYMARIITKCNADFNEKDINNHSKYYHEYGPHPYNYYNIKDKETTFEVY